MQNQAWEDFKVEFNKTYSKCEERKRKLIFLQNKCKIDKVNKDYEAGLVSYSARVYQWSDLTDEEFRSSYSGGIQVPSDVDEEVVYPDFDHE